jgi:hypothetical protein
VIVCSQTFLKQDWQRRTFSNKPPRVSRSIACCVRDRGQKKRIKKKNRVR